MEFLQALDFWHVGLADHASDSDEYFVEVPVFFTLDSDVPLLPVVVEDDLLDRCIEPEMWF